MKPAAATHSEPGRSDAIRSSQWQRLSGAPAAGALPRCVIDEQLEEHLMEDGRTHGSPHFDDVGNRNSGLFQPLMLWSIFLFAVPASPALGEATKLPADVHRFTSQNFVLYTDLDAQEANLRLRRLDRLISSVSKYWGQRLTGKIDCYLVDDIDNWRDFEFDIPNVRLVLEKVLGGTDLRSATNRGAEAKATVYATTDLGVAEHEAVHAYCFQTFGRGGPEWYREGMAQVFAQIILPTGVESSERLSTITCIRSSPFSSGDVFRLNNFTATITREVRSASPKAESLDDMSEVRLRYAQAWALCHLLTHHPDYRERFRALGRGTLVGAPVSFSKAFAAVQHEIDFELAQLGEHYDTGYRVDRCRWHWNQPFVTLDPGRVRIVRVRAGVGFQPSGIRVAEGGTYEIACQGEWSVSNDGPPCDANGNQDGTGRLIAVVMDDYELTEPTKLGTDATFTSGGPGKLYFRCQDAWNQLSDNRGTLTLRIRRIK